MGDVQSGTPGRVFENLIILGSAPGEGYGSPPGDLRAYDVHTGKTVWSFHTVPHPGEYGYDTWPPDAWKYIGGTNTWGGATCARNAMVAQEHQSCINTAAYFFELFAHHLQIVLRSQF